MSTDYNKYEYHVEDATGADKELLDKLFERFKDTHWRFKSTVSDPNQTLLIFERGLFTGRCVRCDYAHAWSRDDFDDLKCPKCGCPNFHR